MENEVKGARARERARQLKGLDDWVEIEVPARLGVAEAAVSVQVAALAMISSWRSFGNFGKCA